MNYSTRKNGNIPTIKIVKCPACSKNRMHKYANKDGTVNQPSGDTIDVRGEVRYVETCQFCREKYEKRDKQYMKQNMKKINKAIQDGSTTDEDFYLDEI